MSSEELIQQNIRLDAARSGIDLWRNNVGACVDATGRMVRYGLLNDSKRLNEQYKSSDLIGVRPVLVTQDMVGSVLGVFTAIECKASAWTPRLSDPHTMAQRRFHGLVIGHGGFAGFAQTVGEARRIMRLE